MPETMDVPGAGVGVMVGVAVGPTGVGVGVGVGVGAPGSKPKSIFARGPPTLPPYQHRPILFG